MSFKIKFTPDELLALYDELKYLSKGDGLDHVAEQVKYIIIHALTEQSKAASAPLAQKWLRDAEATINGITSSSECEPILEHVEQPDDAIGPPEPRFPAIGKKAKFRRRRR